MARPRHRAQRAHRQGRQPLRPALPPLKYDPKEARERLKKAGYKDEEIVIETTVGYTANDKPMSEAIQGMWRDAGINAKVEVVEYSVRAQKNRDKIVQGPVVVGSDLHARRSRRHDVAAARARAGRRTTGATRKWDELGEAARFSVDEKFRGQAYKEMTQIVLEHFPWIPVIQPYEDYGLQKHVEWTPNPNQAFEIRRFNFKFRRA